MEADAAEFLFGSRGLLPYRLILAACVGAGTLIPIDMVWELGELFNLLMAACKYYCPVSAIQIGG